MSIILYILSFPPFNLSFFIFLTLIPLFILLPQLSPKESFIYGFLYGFGFYGVNFYWLPTLLNHFVSRFFGISVTLLLVSYLSIYPGIFLWGVKKKKKSLLFPAFFWCFLEFIRSIGPLSFNWGTLGEPLVNIYPLLQWASVFGGLGLSFIVVLMNTILYNFKFYSSRKKTYSIIFMFFLIFFGNVLETPTNSPILRLRIGAVQGNYDSFLKVYERNIEEQLEIHKNLTLSLPKNLYLIIWPESVLFCPLNYYPQYIEELENLSREMGSFLIVGALKYEDNKIYNSAYLFSPFEKGFKTYSKVQLVPFVEELPFSFLFPPFVKSLVGNYTKGEGFFSFKTPLINIGTLICFESLFSHPARSLVKDGANILVVITNDGWFQRTPAVWQHRNLSLIRAVENRVPLIQVANTGITFFADPYGKILKESKEGEKNVYYYDIPIYRNNFSLYRIWGDLFMFITFIIYLLFKITR
ncbi:MAG: apolipoprotein N-acyltransferase [Dictyoglomaceae bacterium]